MIKFSNTRPGLLVCSGLEVPQTLSGTRVERDDAVAEEVVAVPVAAVKVVARSTGRNEDDAALGVHRRLTPIVYAAECVLGVVRPRVSAELAGPRHGMEDPYELACAHVVGVDVGRCRRVACAACGQRHDDQILEHAAGVARLQRPHRVDVVDEADAKVHSAILAKRFDRFAGFGVDCGQNGSPVSRSKT